MQLLLSSPEPCPRLEDPHLTLTLLSAGAHPHHQHPGDKYGGGEEKIEVNVVDLVQCFSSMNPSHNTPGVTGLFLQLCHASGTLYHYNKSVKIWTQLVTEVAREY